MNFYDLLRALLPGYTWTDTDRSDAEALIAQMEADGNPALNVTGPETAATDPDALAQLDALRNAGILSDAEYNDARSRVPATPAAGTTTAPATPGPPVFPTPPPGPAVTAPDASATAEEVTPNPSTL